LEAWQSLVYCNSLENCRPLTGSVGSNPTASARFRGYMKDHVHTDECWEPDSGCDMGRNEEFVGRMSKQAEVELNKALDEMFGTRTVPAYITDEDTRYNSQYDVYYNFKTGEWLEPKCSDPQCEFCSVRPDKAPLVAEDYKGIIYPLPHEVSEQEKEQYVWGSNAAYEYAAKLRRKKDE
jgi:hypothetical protein